MNQTPATPAAARREIGAGERPPRDPARDWRRPFVSTLTYLGAWAVVAMLFGVAFLLASDRTSSACTGFCFSGRGTVIILGAFAAVASVPGHVVGLVVLRLAERRMTSAAWAGGFAFTVSFLLTLLAMLVVVAGGAV